MSRNKVANDLPEMSENLLQSMINAWREPHKNHDSGRNLTLRAIHARFDSGILIDLQDFSLFTQYKVNNLTAAGERKRFEELLALHHERSAPCTVIVCSLLLFT